MLFSYSEFFVYVERFDLAGGLVTAAFVPVEQLTPYADYCHRKGMDTGCSCVGFSGEQKVAANAFTLQGRRYAEHTNI